MPKMLIDRRARFGPAKLVLLAFIHIFIASVTPPSALADDRSVTSAAHLESARRLANLSFKVIEGSNHGRIPAEGHDAVSHRRSHHRGVNREENHVPRGGGEEGEEGEPVSTSRRHTHYGDAEENEKESRGRDENQNTNVNTNHGALNTIGKFPPNFWDGVKEQGQHVHGTKTGEDQSIGRLETKLHSIVTFRVNIITVFGQLIKFSNNILTADQYNSLNLIIQALGHRQVYMFNVLPILKKLQNAQKPAKFRLVMQALANNVPAYLTSACKFWVNEIDKRRIDIVKITQSIAYPADFLDGIDPQVIDTCKVKVAAEELEPIDEASRFTKTTLGPVFVNVFVKLKNRQIKLTQKLFGAVLANLPVGKLNPVFEEYVGYVSDAAEDNLLPNWQEIAANIRYGNPYEIVSFVIEELLRNRETPNALKHALQYILLHIKETPNNIYDEYYPDMQMILSNERNVAEKLFSMIPDDFTVPEQSHLRDKMMIEISQVNVEAILRGMNKFVYRKPIDLLIGLLARMQGRVGNKDVAYTVTNLLSVLTMKEELGSFTNTVSPDVDVIGLLNFLNLPNIDPDISALGEKIREHLDGDLNLLKNVQTLVPRDDKSKCRRPIQCLLYIFEEATEPDRSKQLGISENLLEVIENLYQRMTITINSSVICKPQDVMSFEIPDMSRNRTTDVIFQFVPEQSETTRPPALLTSPEPTEFVHWSSAPTIPSVYKEVPKKPEEEVFPTFKVPDRVTTRAPPYLPSNNTTHPDRWGPWVDLDLQKSKPTRGPMPWPGPRPTRIVQVPTLRPTLPPPKNKGGIVPTTPRTPMNNLPHPPGSQPEKEPVLPPNIKYDRPIFVIFPADGAPPYTTLTEPTDKVNPEVVISLPSIKELMQGLNPNTPFNPNDLPDIPELMEPLKQTLGANFIDTILGKRVNKAQYPTVVSLMDDVLAHALEHPNIVANFELVALIRKYRKGIEYICMTALFPVVIDSQKLTSDLIYVIFDPENPNAFSIQSEEPEGAPPGFMTLPIYHPKYWIQQVDPSNPYGTLIPLANEHENNPIQDLLQDGSLPEILGPDFDSLIYPNRGTLLMTVLQKLVMSPQVKAKPWLTKKLYAYLNCIRTIAMFSRIPSDYGTHLIELQRDNEVNWQPDTASLILALPPARNEHEIGKLSLVRTFLSTPNLLQQLQISNPPYSMTRGTLLKMIFNAAIRGHKIVLDHATLSALKYYERQILINGHGALPIVWIWVQMFIIREEIPLGEIIEATLDYQSLPHSSRLSYNHVMTYLTENPQFLQGNDDFPYEKYHTKGTFLRGLFSHLLTRMAIPSGTKKHIKKLIPHIKLLGRGSERLNHVTLNDIRDHSIVPNGYSVLVNSY